MIVEYVRKGGGKKFQKAVIDGKLVPIKRSRNQGGNRIGVLVAVPVDDKIRVGWSLCNVKAGDTFDPKFGMNIATDRATKHSKAPIATSLTKKAKSFIDRMRRYYKDKEIEAAFRWNAQPNHAQPEGEGC